MIPALLRPGPWFKTMLVFEVGLSNLAAATGVRPFGWKQDLLHSNGLVVVLTDNCHLKVHCTFMFTALLFSLLLETCCIQIEELCISF